jgi:transcriptional regulator with XRE-family HTH domain
MSRWQGREKVGVNVVKEVGKKIRLLRTSRSGPRVTQEELADKAEISVSFLSMIERGERAPHLETLSKLAGALAVPITELFSFDSDPDKVDALYRPLIEFCRKQTMTKKDVDRLLAVARSVFS